jgi:hypothetical protein
MFGKQPDQKAGEGAAAIQAGGSADGATVHQTNNYGLTVTLDEIRALARDSFRADFVQLLGQAGDIAEARANRVTESFLERLQAENPAGINQTSTPDFRYALLSAQKAQARSGDENLEKLLVELLIERSREQERSLQQIVLNEALDVAARLTAEQVSALTLSFVIRRTTNNGVLDMPSFVRVFVENAVPFISNAKLSVASFSHLAYTGCGVVEVVEASLTHCLTSSYPELWQRGFSLDDPTVQALSEEARQVIRPSQNNPGKYEVIGGSVELSKKIRDHIVKAEADRALVNELLSRGKMNDEEIKERCIAALPQLVELFDLWDNTPMKNFSPSSIGIAIAHANMTRVVPHFGPLSIWIN